MKVNGVQILGRNLVKTSKGFMTEITGLSVKCLFLWRCHFPGLGNPIVVEDHHMLMEFAEYSDGRLVCFEVDMEVC